MKLPKPSSPPPWEAFAAKSFKDLKSEPFREVSHVSHIASALNIVRDELIRPQLVYDKSKLNTQRILVCWVSPNYWGNGFRYGNIMFEFDIDQLLKEKNTYWVESISYSPPACRILVTPNTYPPSSGLLAYDLKTSRGPWRFDVVERKHYRNKDYTLEIMYEGELPLSACERIRYVPHHEHQCSISPSTCADRNKLAMTAAAEFIGGIVAEDIDPSILGFSEKRKGKIRPSAELLAGLGGLLIWSKTCCAGAITAGGVQASAIARAICASTQRGDKQERKALAKLFKSRDDLVEALTDLIVDRFSLDTVDYDDE